MKKVFCLILALLLMLTACGTPQEPPSSVETTQTIVPTEETSPLTETVETESSVSNTPAEEEVYNPSAEELLSKEETTTLTNVPEQTYIDTLRELGYVEVLMNTANPDSYAMPFGATIQSLTYNSHAMKMEFLVGIEVYNNSGKIVGTQTNLLTLYGTKDSGLRNFSGLSIEEYENKYNRDSLLTPNEYILKDAAHPISEFFELFNDEDNGKLPAVGYTGIYYPETQNLYNTIEHCENLYTGSVNAAGVFPPTASYMQYLYKQRGVPHSSIFSGLDPTESTIRPYMYYEEDMSWLDWVDSQYNIDGWTLVEEEGCNKVLLSPCEQYVAIVYNDMKTGSPMLFKEFLTPEEAGYHVATTNLVMTIEQWNQMKTMGILSSMMFQPNN